MFKKFICIVFLAIAGMAYYKYKHWDGTSFFTARKTAPVSSNHSPIGAIGSPYGHASAIKNHAAERANNANTPDATLLMNAANNGDIDEIIAELKKHVPVDARDGQRHTALMSAARAGKNTICTLLLANGSKVLAQDLDGFNALDYAAAYGHVETVELLLTKSKTPDTKYHKEYATLMQAALTADENSLPPISTPLHTLNRLTPEGQSPLHIAASNGAASLAAALIKRGANINLPNQEQQTPLHWAAWNDQLFTIALLLKKGAHINAHDSSGNSPLMLAAAHGNKEASLLLLQNHADTKMLNKQQKTAAMLAEANSHYELAILLH